MGGRQQPAMFLSLVRDGRGCGVIRGKGAAALAWRGPYDEASTPYRQKNRRRNRTASSINHEREISYPTGLEYLDPKSAKCFCRKAARLYRVENSTRRGRVHTAPPGPVYLPPSLPARWCRLASSANSSRLETPTFAKILLKWRFTVSSLMDNLTAISRLLFPA